MCTWPGLDSHRAGCITPSPSIMLLSNSNLSVAVHVLPPSSLRSTKASQTLFNSVEAGASQVPFERIIGLFLTGPLPPLSPSTSSFGSDQVSPSSSEYCTQVSQKSISFPTLK